MEILDRLGSGDLEWSRFSGQLFKHLQATSRSKSQGAMYPFLECNRCLLQRSSMHLNTSCLASSLDLHLLSFISSRLSVLKNDSAAAFPFVDANRTKHNRALEVLVRVAGDAGDAVDAARPQR